MSLTLISPSVRSNSHVSLGWHFHARRQYFLIIPISLYCDEVPNYDVEVGCGDVGCAKGVLYVIWGFVPLLRVIVLLMMIWMLQILFHSNSSSSLLWQPMLSMRDSLSMLSCALPARHLLIHLAVMLENFLKSCRLHVYTFRWYFGWRWVAVLP